MHRGQKTQNDVMEGNSGIHCIAEHSRASQGFSQQAVCKAIVCGSVSPPPQDITNAGFRSAIGRIPINLFYTVNKQLWQAINRRSNVMLGFFTVCRVTLYCAGICTKQARLSSLIKHGINYLAEEHGDVLKRCPGEPPCCLPPSS